MGVDRDSGDLAHLFDERNPVVLKAICMVIGMVIEAALEAGCKVGICGQGPSDHPDFAEFLVELGIDSLSLNPDVVVSTRRRIAELEAARAG